MSSIPTHLTPEQFAQHVEPRLSKAKRGFVSKIPLYYYSVDYGVQSWYLS